MTRLGRFAAASLALLCAPAALAHEFKLDSAASGFVRVEPGAAHLVVRVPLHAIRSVRFPLNGREIVTSQAGPATEQAIAAVRDGLTLSEGGAALAPSSAVGRLSLPSDRSFDAYDRAVEHVGRENGDVVYADQGFLDVHFTYPIGSTSSRFALRTTLAPELGDLMKVAIRYMPPGDAAARALVLTRGSGAVALNPTRARAAMGFAALGVEHILGGLDHLLFLLCLIVPLVRARQVLGIVTAFTVAHSVTLLGAAFGLAPQGDWFPPLVETLIAASIVYMAIENVLGAELRRRWIATALFGLVHGVGFSYGLKEKFQFAGDHLVTSLFAFNAGVEVGQLAFVAALVPALALLRRRAESTRRAGIVIVSALVAHTAWHWMAERADVLWKSEWPRVDGATMWAVARSAAVALLIAAIVRAAPRTWAALLRVRARHLASQASPRPDGKI